MSDFQDAIGDDPAQYWEHRYADAGQVWSGRVNGVLADVASGLRPGRALDLGCGEGADAIWLAQHGWQVTGVDISAAAIRRAVDAARAAGIADGRLRFLAADLSDYSPEGEVDLVTASFLHSPVELPRTQILRRAAERIAPGGHLLITSHSAPPPRADLHGHPVPDFPSPTEELAALALAQERWQLLTAELRPRQATRPDGETVLLEDSVLLLRRL